MKFFILSFSFIVFLAGVLGHCLYWRQYSLHAIYWQTRGLVPYHSYQSFYELGRICNTLKRFSCSQKNFSQLLEQYPFDTEILFNLAVSEFHLGHHKKSIEYWENYFSLVGVNAEAGGFYAQSLMAENLDKEAISFLYGVLNKEVDLDVFLLLIRFMVHKNPIEALSLFYMYSFSTATYQWRYSLEFLDYMGGYQKQKEYQKAVSYFKQLSQEEKASYQFKLFSQNAESFFAPFRMNKDGLVSPIMLTLGQKNKINKKTLKDNYFFTSLRQNKASAIKKDIVLDSFFIGKFHLRGIVFEVCDNCLNELSLGHLKQYSLLRYRKGGHFFIEEN